MNLPIGYAKRVMKQIQIETYPETDDASEPDADIEDSEEADEEDEESASRSMVNFRPLRRPWKIILKPS